jgi:hypothetical protein
MVQRTARLPSLAAGALPGAALGAAALVAALLRRDKPLHPVGHHGTGTLTVTDPVPALGIPVLAAAGSRPCEARWSRAMGLPSGWPDIEGMALRLPEAAEDEGVADLLLASTGSDAWSRHLLTLRGPGHFGPVTTLLPVRAAGRAVTFMLAPAGEPADGLPPSTYTLHVARGTGDWQRVGRIDLTWSEPDTAERFDPIRHQLAGIEQYPVVTSLREPAYAAARAVTSAGRATRRGRAAAHRAARRAPAASR